jgi:hypothetical protein
VLTLATALAYGAADPPLAGKLVWEARNPGDWPDVSSNGALHLLQSPILLPATPFTLQLTASNIGVQDSAWGIWLKTDSRRQIVLIDNQGYYSLSDTSKPHWVEFIHLRTGYNTLYLNIDKDGMTTLRLDHEVAWTGKLSLQSAWGIVIYHAPVLTWDKLQLYAPGGLS